MLCMLDAVSKTWTWFDSVADDMKIFGL